MSTRELWTQGKSFEDIQDLSELNSDEVIVNLHEDILCLKEDLRLADLLINKIDDPKYKQMVSTYKTLTS